MRRIRWLILVFALVGIVATTWTIATIRPRLHTLLRQQTGEEEWRAQIRGLGHLLSGSLRPRPDDAPYEPVAHAGLYPFGVNTFLQTEADPGRVERTLQMIEEAGFRWIRQEFPWEDIEIHRKGWFVDLRNHEIRNAWRKYDYIVERAEAHNIAIIARLSNPPAWSRAAGNDVGPQAPPDRLEDYCDYVQAVASRYKGRIRYYQIWNEPNIYPEWGTYAISPEQYARLLQTGYTCIEAVDPDAVILTAPLAPTIELTQRDFNDFLFLQRLYDAGAAAWFDVLAVQDYGLWSGPYDRRMRPRVLNFSRPIYIRDIMRRNGDGQKAIWLSEMGWNSTPEGILPLFGRTSEELRARYAVEAFERVQREWPWTGVMTYWFFKQADESEKEQPQYYFRLVEPDFTPTATYNAIKTYLTTLQPTLYRGYHQEDHWALVYAGPWQTVHDEAAVLGAYRQAEAGATLTFGVEGERVVLMLRPETSAVVEFSLDEQAPRRIEVTPGAADPLPLVVAEALGEGRHTIRITVLDGVFNVDGVLVYGP